MSDDAAIVSLPSELARLSNLLDEKLEAFATGDKDIQDAALTAAKFVFDQVLKTETKSQKYIAELLESISPSRGPQTRSQARAAESQAAASTQDISHAILEPTPLSSLHVDGMNEDQVWAQLELKAANVCETLEDAFDASEGPPLELMDSGEDDSDEDGKDKAFDDAEEDENDLMDLDGLGTGVWDDEEDSQEEDDVDEGDEAEEGEGNQEGITPLRDPSSESSDEEDDPELDLDLNASRKPARRKRPQRGHKDLDDGFFNLADFNAEIEEAESKRVSSGALSTDSDDEASEEEEVDWFAPVDDEEPFAEEDLEDAGGVLFYKDFFDVPRKASAKAVNTIKRQPANTKATKVRFHDEVKVKTIKNKSKGRDEDEDGVEDLRMTGEEFDSAELDDHVEDGDFAIDDAEEEDEEDKVDGGREAVDRLKDDLFAEDDEQEQSDLTTHERRMTTIKDQIAQLEAENVAKKDWTLMGEATSKQRPQNSLLEEDLEFERVMKPVPIVTDEVVQDLESRIKARILENRFDDVVRRRAVDDKPFLPSRVFELQDTKSAQSLAQIYEDEFVAARTGDVAGEDRDGKLKKEHEEIEKLWENICYKLDALSNAHFTPKQPKATISTISNVSAVTLESALPTSTSVSNVLAPEEVFSVNPSDLRARSELTPVEKQALRNKERKQKQKQRQQIEAGVDKFAKMNGVKSAKKQKEAALKQVVKTGKGVTVIGKKSTDLKRQKKSGRS